MKYFLNVVCFYTCVSVDTETINSCPIHVLITNEVCPKTIDVTGRGLYTWCCVNCEVVMRGNRLFDCVKRSGLLKFLVCLFFFDSCNFCSIFTLNLKQYTEVHFQKRSRISQYVFPLHFDDCSCGKYTFLEFANLSF